MFWWKIPVLSMQLNTFCAILAKFLKTQEGKQLNFSLSPFFSVAAAVSKLISTPYLFSLSFLSNLIYFFTYNNLRKNIIVEKTPPPKKITKNHNYIMPTEERKSNCERSFIFFIRLCWIGLGSFLWWRQDSWECARSMRDDLKPRLRNGTSSLFYHILLVKASHKQTNKQNRKTKQLSQIQRVKEHVPPMSEGVWPFLPSTRGVTLS